MSLTNNELDHLFQEAREEQPIADYQETTRAFLAATIAISGGVLATKSLVGLFKLKTFLAISGVVVATTTAVVLNQSSPEGGNETTATPVAMEEEADEQRDEIVRHRMVGDTVRQAVDTSLQLIIEELEVVIPIAAEEPEIVPAKEPKGLIFIREPSKDEKKSIKQHALAIIPKCKSQSSSKSECQNNWRSDEYSEAEEEYYASEKDLSYPNLGKKELKKPYKTLRQELIKDRLIDEDRCCWQMSIKKQKIRVNNDRLPDVFYEKYARLLDDLLDVDVYDNDSYWNWTSCHCQENDCEG